MELSQDQREALERIGEWFAQAPEPLFCAQRTCCTANHQHSETCMGPHTHGNAEDHPVLGMGGLAGSGKTTLIRELDTALNGRYPGAVSIVYGTPTNKAASVLRGKLTETQKARVRTFHSLLYRPIGRYWCTRSGKDVTEEDNGAELRTFTPCWQVHGGGEHVCDVQEDVTFVRREHVAGYHHLIVIDEASMVDVLRVNEIRAFGLPLLLVGDHGQLPPVKAVGGMNPWMRSPDIVLTENHRQGEVSGIVTAALAVRQSGRLGRGSYGDGSTAVVSAKEHPAVLDVMNPDRFQPGPERTIITHTNKMRASINLRFHNTVSEGATSPVVGDRVVSLRNQDCLVAEEKSGENGIWIPRRSSAGDDEGALMEPVYNGCTGTVRAVLPGGMGRLVRLVVELDSDARGEPGKHIVTTALADQFGQEGVLPPTARPYAPHHLWDYAYALTAHKAQGSEFDDVIVLDTGAPDWRSWMYTAMTRAKKRLVVINWK